MTKQQLALCAAILNVSETTYDALWLHFVKGVTKAEACRQTGLLPTNLSRAAKSVKRLHEKLLKAYA